MNVRQKYRFCAKGGHEKEESITYVCSVHRRTYGLYTHCAGCGKEWADGESRNYVCLDCLADRKLAEKLLAEKES